MSTSAGTRTGADGRTVRLPVSLDERSYDILIGPGLLAEASTYVAPLLARPHTVIVTDQRVARHHLEPLQAGLAAAGLAVQAIVLPSGEASKSWSTLEDLTGRLLDLGVERRDVVLALGGGVVGDVTGFAAAILRRGVDFIQIPTTLLAQVDSSVGGKTGINVPQGKNLIGAFHQPRLVLADTETLATLPRRDWLSGYAEVVKYAVLGDAAFFDWLERDGPRPDGADSALTRAVQRSCAIKAHIVAADERETGDRALLNLGHTFGHALEAATGFSDRLTHGEGVALGIGLALDLSERLGHAPEGTAARVRAHLRALGLPTAAEDIPGPAPAAGTLLHHMRQDKKAAGGRLVYILVRGIGDAFIARDVAEADVLTLLSAKGYG